MRKASVIPAAVLAAFFALGSSKPAEARKAHHGKSARRSSAGAPKARSGRKPAGSGHGSRRASRRHRADARASRHGRIAGKTRPPKEKTVIRQNDAGEVVIDRVFVVNLPPVAAKDLYNYPPTPCDPTDVVIEAHVHEAAADAPEGDAPEGQAAEQLNEEPEAPAEATPTGARASLSRIAQQLGSFFRPKSSAVQVRPQDVDLTELVSKSFLIPVEGVDAERLRDSFLSSRGRHAKHLAIDIGAPRGTPILATTDGEIVRIARERRGGKSLYQKDATGQYLLFYCHLSKYADDLEVGKKVKKGEVIGYVGSTGHVIGGSHLHFSITRVPDDSANFKQGLAINPYLLFLAGVP